MAEVKSLDDLIATETQPSVAKAFPAKEDLQIDFNLVKKSNVFFATPCYGGNLTDQYFLSMFKMTQELAKLGTQFRVTTLRNESLITRGRNILTGMFMASECTHLMFVDADIEFEAEAILRLISLDEGIVVGAYPKKTLPIQYAVNFKFKNPSTKELNIKNGAIEVHDASTGFFMIKREVIEKLQQRHPDLNYKNDSSVALENKYIYNLFDTFLDKKDHRYLSEDYAFCRLWQEIGGKIWLDPYIKLNHVGSYTFQGDVSQLFKA